MTIKRNIVGALIAAGFAASPALAYDNAQFYQLLNLKRCPHCDLSGAPLAELELHGAILTYANLTGADLTGASLWNADLFGADLTDAILTDTFFCNTTMPDGAINDADCPV